MAGLYRQCSFTHWMAALSSSSSPLELTRVASVTLPEAETDTLNVAVPSLPSRTATGGYGGVVWVDAEPTGTESGTAGAGGGGGAGGVIRCRGGGGSPRGGVDRR